MTYDELETPIPGALVPAGWPVPLAAEAPEAGDDAPPEDRMRAAAAARARLDCERSCELVRDLAAGAAGDPWTAVALNEVAAVRLSQGRLEEAREATHRALERPASGAARVRSMVNLAVGASLAGMHEEALRRLDQASEWRPASDGAGARLVALNRTQALRAAGRLAEAADHAADTLRGARRDKDEHDTALALMGTALVLDARGRRNQARARLGEAVRGFARFDDRMRLVQCHFLLGEFAWAGEDPIRAGSHYRDGLGLAREAGWWRAVELLSLRFEHR